MRRRAVLKWLIGGVGAAMGAVVLVPALITVLSPARSRAQTWRPIGPLLRFPPAGVVKAVVAPPTDEYPVKRQARVVYVWLRTPLDVVVFSPTCTDLGCSINYDPGSEFYYCPCHGGVFNKGGEPVAGPPARPLYRYATRVRGGVLEVDLASVPILA